jgi:hypothetical protein
MVGCDTTPYSGCKYSKRVVEALMKEAGVRNFIETGTFLGHTTRDVAQTFPNVAVQTVTGLFNIQKK